MRAGTMGVNSVGMATLDVGGLSSGSFLQRFRRFIENSNWDARLLGRLKWGNRLSWAIVTASVLYLIAASIHLLSQ